MLMPCSQHGHWNWGRFPYPSQARPHLQRAKPGVSFLWWWCGSSNNSSEKNSPENIPPYHCSISRFRFGGSRLHQSTIHKSDAMPPTYNFAPTWQSTLVLIALSTSLVISIAAGQKTPNFDPGTIDDATREDWCEDELNTCTTLCSLATNINTCNSTSLDYTCTCASNDSAPGLEYYRNTMPTFICEENFNLCSVAASNQSDSTAAQEACAVTEQSDCGHTDPSNFAAVDAAAAAATSTTANSSPSSTQLESDSVSTSTTSTTTTSSSILTSTPTVSNSPIPPPQAPSDSDSPRNPQQPPSGLSTGGKAGIGVGIPILVVLFILGLWFAFRYGRHTRGSAEIKTLEPQHFSVESSSTAQIQEIGSSLTWEEKRELAGRRRAADLEAKSVSVRPGMSERAELEAWRKVGVFELG
ncbi:hypothetical protein L207DRAFT_560533 [Hyaloscypha variabilis F]|uniref:DUF7707 domain-containing protein n=1 Tax=Hyaloscypha variabilis (strain UAMH 11265 / GT02V1 / F) TaxID=1149755 RepID=A0A2J6SE24_HYAVF|nr:hypothetical protein L207DRAFT_560533 [Hyaloscypha variabilis F]